MPARWRTLLLMAAGAAAGSAITLGVQQGLSHRQQQASMPTQGRPLPTALWVKGEPSLGSPQAPLTVVEFSDFQCPYCQLVHGQVLPQLKRDYIDRGLVRFVHKDLPLRFHGQARRAAAVARCSLEQNKFWSVYGALYRRQGCLDCQGPEAIAVGAGLEPQPLSRCLRREQTAKLINTNLSEATLQGIRSTPTFVIGPTKGDQVSGIIVEGAMPWPQFRAWIERELKKVQQP